MPANLLRYPLDYPTEITGDGDSYAFDDAISSLEVQARDTALQQSHTRRISGQNEIQNQNRLVKAKTLLMPLTSVGAKPAPVLPIQGTVAYLSGGRAHNGLLTYACRLTYSNDTAGRTGLRSSEPRTYQGSLYNTANGYYCGGSGSQGLRTTIEELNYAKVLLRRLGVQLAQARNGLAGIGNKTAGVLLGGVTYTGSAVRTGSTLTYASLTMANNSTSLVTGRFAPHNGTSTPTMGFLYGGATGNWNNFLSTQILSIESYTFASATAATVGTSLTRPHLVHACFGSTLKGYITGGSVTNNSSYIGDTGITCFTYSGQTVSTLSATMPEPKCCQDGAGSSVAGYAMGGDTNTSNWVGTTTIDKLTYSDESIRRIGAQLPQTMADQGAISDYAASLY